MKAKGNKPTKLKIMCIGAHKEEFQMPDHIQIG